MDIDMAKWIGIDLDKTLAEYYPGDYRKYGPLYIGDPIQDMVFRVQRLIESGIEVRIFTARMADPIPDGVTVRQAIIDWCKTYVYKEYDWKVTCVKDRDMVALYDDRAITVEANTGSLIKPTCYLSVIEDFYP